MSFRSEHVATYTGETFQWEKRQEEFRRQSPNGAFVLSFLYHSSRISHHYKASHRLPQDYRNRHLHLAAKELTAWKPTKFIISHKTLRNAFSPGVKNLSHNTLTLTKKKNHEQENILLAQMNKLIPRNTLQSLLRAQPMRFNRSASHPRLLQDIYDGKARICLKLTALTLCCIASFIDPKQPL